MTIAHVASQAGVSIATVSRAFNSPQLVARDTLARVQRTSDALGFVPNASARTLRTQRSRIVGVVLPTLLNPVFAECLEGIAAAANESGYAIVPLVTHYQIAREKQAIGQLLARNVDGVILTVASAARSTSLARLRRHAVPYVLAYNRHPRQPCVSVDGEKACGEVVRWLLALGHRRIAMVSGTLAASDRAQQRHRGFAQAMAQAGLPEGELIEVPFMQAAEQTITRRLAAADRPTALLCSNDLLALRCLRAAALAGVSVPATLSVVGFDGIAIGEALSPQLSTVVQPSRDIGHACLSWLVRDLQAGQIPRPATSIDLPYTIRSGESCVSQTPAVSSRRRASPSANPRSQP